MKQVLDYFVDGKRDNVLAANQSSSMKEVVAILVSDLGILGILKNHLLNSSASCMCERDKGKVHTGTCSR